MYHDNDDTLAIILGVVMALGIMAMVGLVVWGIKPAPEKEAAEQVAEKVEEVKVDPNKELYKPYQLVVIPTNAVYDPNQGGGKEILPYGVNQGEWVGHYRVVVIDGCEYIKYVGNVITAGYFGLAHKGNCTNSCHIYKLEDHQ